MNLTKHPLVKLAAVAAVFISTSTAALAEGTGWSLRVRATYLEMANKSDAFTALGINFASNAVHVNSKFIPEFDVSYAFTPQFSTELVLTIPQSQDVSLAGVGHLGSFKHLPPSLLAQYHFLPAGEAFQPYLGVGLNFTLIWGGNLSVANVPLALEHSSVGLAFQAGFDYTVAKDQYINVDIKKVGLQSDVSAGGSRLTTAKLDPWLLSIGYGWKF